MIFYFVSGIFLGLAQLVPGLSSATVAVVLGLYDSILSAFNRCVRHPFSSWSSVLFLGTLFFGACTGFLLFSSLLLKILRVYPVVASFSFMGLVLGTIPSFYHSYLDKYSFDHKSKFIFLFFFCFVALFAFIPHVSFIDLNVQTSVVFYLFLFFSGFLTATAMLVPGMSGSLVLLLLGAYDFILTAILSRQIEVVLVFSLGVFAGILLMSQLIHLLLRKFKYQYYVAILGLLLASVCGLWPAKIDSITQLIIGGSFCIAMTFFMYHLSMRFKKTSIA